MQSPGRRYATGSTVMTVRDIVLLFNDDLDPAPVIPAQTRGTVTRVRIARGPFPYNVAFHGFPETAVAEADLRRAV